MSKGLRALKRLVGWFGIPPETDKRAICYKDIESIEQELKDFEWLKSKINIDFFYQLSSEDREKLTEILGVKL